MRGKEKRKEGKWSLRILIPFIHKMRYGIFVFEEGGLEI